MEIVKGNSSKWAHKAFPEKKNFAWQDGYGAFSVCKSLENATIEYIRNQQTHHKKKSFKEEFTDILKKHGMEFDEKYIWK